MTWPVYDNGTAYLTAMVQEVYPTDIVHVGNSVPIMDWFAGAAVHLNSFFVSYDGFTSQPRENSRGPLALQFSIYWHGRGLDEAVMTALADHIHQHRTFTIDAETHTASVTGGRYLLLDRGFDTYQLDIQIT